MTIEGSLCAAGITVLLANSRSAANDRLAGFLRDHGYTVLSCDGEVSSIMGLLEDRSVDIAVLSCTAAYSELTDMTALRTLHLTHPQIPKICLLRSGSRELAVQAFRSGARGLFCLTESPLQQFCECIERVYRGEIFATTEQLNYLLDSVCQVPSLRMVSANGEKLLTSREEQVVALVADGLSNRDVASELGLSEHTVKKYLFRIFEKLGISSRVELVLYTLHHGSPQQMQWIGAGA